MVKDNEKNKEELPFQAIELLGDMSEFVEKIGQAENEEEIKKIFTDSNVKPIMDAFEETMQTQNKFLLNEFYELKMKYNDEIEIHNNIVKILSSVDTKSQRMNELIQKENELIKYLKKRIDFLNKTCSQIKMVVDLIPSIKAQDKLEIEIKKLAKEVNLDDIMSDK